MNNRKRINIISILIALAVVFLSAVFCYGEEVEENEYGFTIIQSPITNNLIYQADNPLNVRGLMLHSVGENKPDIDYWMNKYNKEGYGDAAVHAFIDGNSGDVYQTMPWNVRAGHAGKPANDIYIGIEICETNYIDYCADEEHFTILKKDRKKALESAERTYNTSVELFAYLCDEYGLDPLEDGVILSHNEWRLRGNPGHHDPEHYWDGLWTGYTMDGFREAVKHKMDEMHEDGQ